MEAARAGEHGKGFAVVASEVRKLAERSKDAAVEIVDLANESVSSTEQAVALMEKLLPQIENISFNSRNFSGFSGATKWYRPS